MLRATLQLLLLLTAAPGSNVAAASEPWTPACDRSRTVRVLFVGNSFTYVNNVPRLVDAIAAELPGPCVESAMIAIGGATLAMHWSADSVTRRIRAGRWTHVVLNDQSAFGEQWWLNGRPRVGTSGSELAEFAGRFAREIRAAGAEPVLLAHWSDDGAPGRDQQAIDYAFAHAARTTGSIVAPVGQAVKRIRTAMPAVTPYFTDGHHLSAAGSYLEALVLYATLTGHSPVGAVRRVEGPAVDFNQGLVYRDSIVALVDIPAGVAAELQRIAAEIHAAWSGRNPPVDKPVPLSAEFPRLQAHGDPIDADSLAGRWRGSSTVLPAPSNQAVEIELVLQPRLPQTPVADSVYLRVPQIEFAGPVSWRIEGDQAVGSGTVTPRARVGRAGPPMPFTIELRAVLHGGVLSGIARMHQPASEAVPSSFDAVGHFELAREDGRPSSPASH